MTLPSKSRATMVVEREKKLRFRIVLNMLRLFTGLALQYPVRRNVELVLEHLRPLAPLAWSPTDNFHITTKFIGAWEEARLDELKAALAEVKKVRPVTVKVGGFGWYPNPHHPRVLFAGVRAPEALYELERGLEDCIVKLGVVSEGREYVPHMTLARVKGTVELAGLRQAIAQLPSADFGESKAAKFLLYKSEGGVYQVIGEFVL